MVQSIGHYNFVYSPDMSFQSFIPVFEFLGFSDKEAKVYLATLIRSHAPNTEIAEEAGMNRVTTYEILKKLKQKNIVYSSEKDGVLRFTAISPSELHEKFSGYMVGLHNAIPQIDALRKENLIRPQVRFLEGIHGVKEGYNATLETKGEILNIANSKNIRDHWKRYDEEYVAKRAEKKIFLRGIAPNDTEGERVHANDEKYFREIRLLDQALLPTDMVENEICIFDNSVLIVSFQPDIFAILITSPAVMQTQKQIFEILWNIAKV